MTNLDIKYSSFAAIRTRFMGPTDTKGTRIRVIDGGRSERHTMNWDFALSHGENHAAAAQEWLNLYIPGSRIDWPGLVFDGDYYFTWEKP